MAAVEEEEAGVVGDQGEAAFLLRGGPADPRFAGLEVEGGGAPGQQGEPLALVFGHVAELFADEGSASQVVLGDEQLVEALAFRGGEEADADPIEQALVVVGRNRSVGASHAGKGKRSAGGSSVLSSIPLSCRRFRNPRIRLTCSKCRKE